MYPVDLSLLHNVNHMPALPVLQRSMNRPGITLCDFCIPVNPYFPTKNMLDDLKSRLGDVLRYYPSDNQSISNLLGNLLGLDEQHIVVANGSTELITWIHERLMQGPLVTDVPTFGRWTDNAREQDRSVYPFFRKKSNQFQLDVDALLSCIKIHNARSLAICNPNNPTGALLERSELRSLLDATRHLDLVVVDESFIDFAYEKQVPSIANEIVDRDNVIVIKSLGKNFGLHGLRCGYAVANTKLVTQLRHVMPPWNVNSLAEEMIRLLSENWSDYEQGRRQVVRDTLLFQQRLAQVDGLTTFSTHANFVFSELSPEINGQELRDALLVNRGCFVRECGSKIGSSSQFLRIATRPPSQQQLLVASLESTIAQIRSRLSRQQSNSGKGWTGVPRCQSCNRM